MKEAEGSFDYAALEKNVQERTYENFLTKMFNSIDAIVVVPWNDGPKPKDVEGLVRYCPYRKEMLKVYSFKTSDDRERFIQQYVKDRQREGNDYMMLWNRFAGKEFYDHGTVRQTNDVENYLRQQGVSEDKARQMAKVLRFGPLYGGTVTGRFSRKEPNLSTEGAKDE